MGDFDTEAEEKAWFDGRDIGFKNGWNEAIEAARKVAETVKDDFGGGYGSHSFEKKETRRIIAESINKLKRRTIEKLPSSPESTTPPEKFSEVHYAFIEHFKKINELVDAVSELQQINASRKLLESIDKLEKEQTQEPECKCYHNAWEKVTRFCEVHKEKPAKKEWTPEHKPHYYWDEARKVWIERKQ